jgi:hypothetical protein
MNTLPARTGHVLAIAILLLVPFIFFWQMTVEGREPLAPDTQAARPLGLWATEAQKAAGKTPVWCPMIFSGMPSYGSFIHTPSSPLDLMRWMRSIFPGSRGMRYFISLAIGALALYLLLLRWRLRPIGALTGAFSFCMTPYFLGLVAAGHSTKLQALYLAPLVFLAVQVLLERRTLAAVGFLAASVAVQFWSNHPQISYYTLMLAALYFVLTLVFDRPDGWRGRAWITGTALGLVALALAAGMVLEPYAAVLEYTPYSIRGGTGELAADGGGGAGWEYATAWSYPIVGMVEFLFPGWFGLEGSTYWGRLPFTQSTHYFGITVLLLALIGIARGGGRRRWILLALSGVVLLVGLGRNFPVLYGPMYKLLPMFNRFRVPSMIYSLLPLLLAGLVGAGVDRIVEGGRVAARGGGKRAPAPAAQPSLGGWLGLAVAASALLVLWLLLGGAIAEGMRGGGAFLKSGEMGSTPSALLAQLTRSRIGIFRQTIAIGLFLVALGAWLIEARRRGVLTGALAGALLFVWVGADLWVIDRKFYDPRPRAETEAALAPDAVVDFLRSREQPFRIAPLYGQEFRSDRYAAFGLETIGGYQVARLRIYDDLMSSRAIFAPAVLSMLNVSYVLTDRSLADAGFPLDTTIVRAAGDTVFVHENPSVMPRAWFVGQTRTVGSAREMLTRLAAPEFDPGRVAYFYRDETGLIPETLSPGSIRPLDAEGNLQGFRARAEEIALPVRVLGPQPGLLMLSEIHYKPGWRAEIDGQPVPILRANHVLRAVMVPPGDHLVRLVAVAPGLARGKVISHISGLLVIGLLLSGLVSRWRGSRRARSDAAP